MVARITMLSPAVNAALRQVRFDDAPLDESAARRARAAASALPPHEVMCAAPSQRCRGTAEALGLDAAVVRELRDLDVGRWRGRSLDAVAQEAPEEVAEWLDDPAVAPHGGESVLDLVDRVGNWLESWSGHGGLILAVAEPAVVRAGLVHALAIPAQTFWRLDVAPLSVTELSGRSGRWNLRCGRPLTAAG
ncbi:histidine phosphatase family protein [Streptomyces sp. NBC_00996]|uniref:histidine phosphatase family protein n=1 Tax=Streptomyces sp. NBC_00996 TaxID=2903710 RepID=UPI003863E130|nr:histidine phosphatase family protein [Streptomyces sp. NBC_00996]